MSSKLMKLQAAIKYGEEDLAGAKSLVDQVFQIYEKIVSIFDFLACSLRNIQVVHTISKVG